MALKIAIVIGVVVVVVVAVVLAIAAVAVVVSGNNSSNNSNLSSNHNNEQSQTIMWGRVQVCCLWTFRALGYQPGHAEGSRNPWVIKFCVRLGC